MIPKPTCELCGAVLGDTLTHKRWHDSQQEIVDYCRELGKAVYGDNQSDFWDGTPPLGGDDMDGK